MASPYQPIENHGVIGNLRTAALVAMNGSIDWLCLPHFDSPSVFASILDHAKGGSFDVFPAVDHPRPKQFYWPDTNILVTRFLQPDGVGQIEDFMPVGGSGPVPNALIRRVHVVRGKLPFTMRCRPAFDYARDPHTVTITGTNARFDSSRFSLHLASPIPIRQEGDAVAADFTLGEGEHATFILSPAGADGEHPRSPGRAESEDLFRDSVEFWRRWLSRCTYTGRWREIVHRSALTLKLLTFEPTGAIVAAPTCSLPEVIGGERNWDYRYSWIRDAAFTVYALIRIGFTEEATGFLKWLEECSRRPRAEGAGPLQVLYSIDGRTDLAETTLDHLEGHRGSGPVRIGNDASRQLQLDIYGELMDAVYLHNKYVQPVGFDHWTRLQGIINWLEDNWQEPDDGIWEVRGGRRQFVYSKFMCWVAFDRALRLADKRSLPAPRDRWLQTRDTIYREIMEKGWNAQMGTFVQHYGAEALDASHLLMPLVFFMAPGDPRMLSTLDAIRRPLSHGGLAADGLVYRYNPDTAAPDGLRGYEGTFNMCSFWLVEALTRAGSTEPARLDDARLLFEQMIGYSNHLGLYAEQTSSSGEALGNFPQAFTHLALISAAYNLDRALGPR